MGMRRLWASVLAVVGAVCFGWIGLIFLNSIRQSWSREAQPVASAFFGVELPCAISGTPMVAHRLVRYDGAMALLLENPTRQGIEEVRVTLCQAGQQMRFEAERIPPKGRMLVLEKSREDHSGKATISGSCRQVQWELSEKLQTWEETPGILYIKNISDTPMADLRIFHRDLYTQPEQYLGAFSYETRLPSLAPGQTAKLYPDHYKVGSSQVVWICYQ